MKKTASRYLNSDTKTPLAPITVLPTKYDANDPQFLESFRSFRSAPLANRRRNIMEFDIALADKKNAKLSPVQSLSEEVDEKLVVVEKKRRKPPLAVKLRRLNHTRFDEIRHDIVIGNFDAAADSIETNPNLSPRSILLKESMEKNMIPFAIKEILIDSFVKRTALQLPQSIIANVEIMNNSIIQMNLHDFGLGDDKGLILAKALALCPAIQNLNLAGNRLTDTSMVPLLSAVFLNLQCTVLDVSNNTLDSDSVDILKADLRSPSCRLEKLYLSRSDIEDTECASLMESLHKNKSLQFLDLSHNRIGEMEEYNAVNPDFLTGGESIAEMLLQNNCLLHLDLSWNNIRKDSAKTLVELLANNNNLRTLALAHNNLGDYVGQCLGTALRSNAALTNLDISFNNILPHGIMVISHALEKNEVLKELNINGNSLGPIGARSIMRAVRLVAATKRVLKVTFENSNLNYIAPGLFNRAEPSGEYNMDMSHPYDYTVTAVLYEIANAKSATKFRNIMYQPPNSTKWKKITLTRASNVLMLGSIPELIPSIAKGLQFYQPHLENPSLTESLDNLLYILGIDDPPELLLKNILYHLSSLPVNKRGITQVVFRTIFKILFKFIDNSPPNDAGPSIASLDHSISRLRVSSQTVSTEDITEAFEILQCKLTLWPCNIEIAWSEEDFVRSLLMQYTETTPPSPPPLIDQQTQAAWVPPTSGTLQFTFEFESLPPSTGELASNDGLGNLVDAVSAGTSSQQSKANAIKLAVCDDLYLSSEQARQLMIHSIANAKDNLAIVEQFLPQLSSPFETCKFLTHNLTYDEILLLRVKMGNMFKAVTGNACGFYSLDLSKTDDALLLKKLNEINCFDKNKTMTEHPKRNTSQAGDWENFRNEKLNGKSVRLNSKFFYNIPSAGRLQIDFVSTSRPVLGITPISEQRLKAMLSLIFGPIFCHPDRRRPTSSEAEKHSHRRESKKVNQIDEESIFAVDAFKAYWAHIQDSSWECLKTRYVDSLYEKVEEAKAGLGPRFQDDPGKAFQAAVYTKLYRDARNEPIYKTKKANLPLGYSSGSAGSELDRPKSTPATQPPASRQGKDRFSTAAAGRKNISQSSARTARDNMALQCAIFEGSLQKLEAYLCYNVWFLCKQIVHILKSYIGRCAPTNVLSRVVCTLFNRIIDLENFCIVLNSFDHELKLELIHRLGILNVWCPMMPDGNIELDLCAWDHRETAKLIIRLAVIEPGENWVDERYFPSVIEPEVPGWELPVSWTEEDGDGKGPATNGYITMSYSSDPNRGCSPLWSAREELTFARCLAGTCGTFIRGLNVRPKSKTKKPDANDKGRSTRLNVDPIYEGADHVESETDYFHYKSIAGITQKFYGDKAKFQRAVGKF